MGTTATGTSGIPFFTWTIDQCKKAAAIATDVLAAIKENRSFVEGDHWQSGEGWIGPWPMPGEAESEADSEALTTLQGEIERMFTSRNALGEVTERHVSGVVGREPRWSFVPRTQSVTATGEDAELTDEQKRQRSEIEDALTVWWDDAGAHAVLQELSRKLLYGESGSVRIFVPSGLLTPTAGGGKRLNVTRGDLADALSKIAIEAPEPEDCVVVTDDDSGLDVGILLTKDENSRESAELSFLDEGGKTVILVINPARAIGDSDRAEVRFDLGGRLLMMEIDRTEFLTEQARQSQRALNYANTMIVRNVTTGGFLEEILLNVKLPGHWEETPTGKKYVPDPIYRGPSTLNSYSGIETEDAQGNKTVATPQVYVREPVKPDASIAAKQEHYADILDETDQRHVLIAGDAVTSAVSRVQARADYRSSLQISEAPINMLGRWVLETVLAYAEALALMPGRFTRGWRASFACILDAGPLTPEEIAAIQGSVEKRLISRGTARELIGIADPDAEQQRIDDEDGIDLDEELKRAQLFKAYVDAGLDFELAATMSGMTDEQIAALKAIEPPEPEPAPAPAPGGRPPAPRPAPTAAGA